MTVDELRQPRIADTGVLCDGRPFTSPTSENGPNGDVERLIHSPIIVKDSLERKEHFTSQVFDPLGVPTKHINQVVAENLAYWMGESKMTQQALAEKAGVSQKTVSNYLNPQQRTEGSKGKPPSPKLTELGLIAEALHIEVWQLTRQMSPKERALYEAIEKAYQELLISAKS